MSAEHHEHVRKHIRVYLWVFAALTAGTIITVAVANVHLGILLGIAAAVIIATVKGSLVAGYFMHLFAERKLIYVVLAFTGLFALAMVGLILATYGDQQGRAHGIFNVPQRHVQPHVPGAAHEPAHPAPEPEQTQTNQPESEHVP
jgi:cytochrome c oxidase subunit 4